MTVDICIYDSFCDGKKLGKLCSTIQYNIIQW